MRVGVVDLATGELQIFEAPAPDYPAETHETIGVPAGYPEALGWDAGARAFGPAPRLLTGLQILGLYTAAQHARARRMLMAVYPPGHPWAGELVDPDGLTQRLVDATLALRDPISTASEFHQSGTGFLRAVGVIESDVEAARIAAGISPEESM